MAKYQAVIFDRNNVLHEYDLDYAQEFFAPLLPISVYELGDRWQAWGERTGFPATVTDEKRFWRGFWHHLSDELGLATGIRDELLAFRYVDVLRPYPDARPALEAAKTSGLRIGVLSNFPLATIEASLAAVNLLDLVDAAYSASMIGVAKPAPGAYHRMLSALDVTPETTLFFDDTGVHIEGAHRVGLHPYLVDRSRNTHDLSRQIVCSLDIMPELLN